jgi:hypothetical protein
MSLSALCRASFMAEQPFRDTPKALSLGPDLHRNNRNKECAMDDLKIFVPITKIDAAKRLVYGVVTAEKPDVCGEVCDYASTKPHYEKWSQNFASATDGKSLGNLRAMHANVAAGKLVEIAFNDEQKRIEICGKVVDDAEWLKVEEGVYTGFSQGGRYLRRWPDPDEPALMRYTAEPLEVSLVDHPCLPEAMFALIKADGSTELRKFKSAAARKAGESAGPSLRAKRSNPEQAAPQAGLLRRSAQRNDAIDELAKVGARHSGADKERIKKAHDLLVGLDPDCCIGGRAAVAAADTHFIPTPQRDDAENDSGEGGTEKLAKNSERNSFTKALAGVMTLMEEISQRVKKIEDQPLPLGTTSVRVAEKSEDSIFPKSAQLLDQPGALEALAEAAIRKAQANPMRAIPGFRAHKE